MDNQQNSAVEMVKNDAGVLVPVEQALADRIASAYFPNCGGSGCNLPPATDADIEWLLNLCRQDFVKNPEHYQRAVELLKRCSEQQLDCEILAPLQVESLFIAQEHEQHPNIIVRMIARICLMCAVGNYIG